VPGDQAAGAGGPRPAAARRQPNRRSRCRRRVRLCSHGLAGAVLGLRRGECAAPRAGRIDLAAGLLAVVEQATRAAHGRTVFGPPKSEAGHRTLSLPDGLVDLSAPHRIRRRLGPGDGPTLVFVSPEGSVLDYGHWRSLAWVPACRSAGLVGVTLHDLRRANAMALVAEGVDLKTAQTRLGHSDPRLTLAAYVQATTDGDRRAADQVRPADDRRSGRFLDPVHRAGRRAGRPGCATGRPRRRCAMAGLPEAPAQVTWPVTCADAGREGGIRTRDLSVPNAA
jgi:integrase